MPKQSWLLSARTCLTLIAVLYGGLIDFVNFVPEAVVVHGVPYTVRSAMSSLLLRWDRRLSSTLEVSLPRVVGPNNDWPILKSNSNDEVIGFENGQRSSIRGRALPGGRV